MAFAVGMWFTRHCSHVFPAERLCGMQADCLEEVEVQQRKAEMARLIAEGLPVFAFPEDALAQSYCPEHSLSGALSDSSPRAPAQAPAPFQLPFTIVTGGEPDETVHDYWFVRKYRCDLVCRATPNQALFVAM